MDLHIAISISMLWVLETLIYLQSPFWRTTLVRGGCFASSERVMSRRFVLLLHKNTSVSCSL